MNRNMKTPSVERTTRDCLSRVSMWTQATVSIETEHRRKRPLRVNRGEERPSMKAPMGFTLIELLIVVVILGIAAAIAVPMISSAASMQIRAAGSMVAADLEYAKSMAISRGQMYSVVFNAGGESYEIQDPNNNVIGHPIKKGFTYEVDFANDGRLDRVDIVSADFDGETAISFDYLGSPYSVGASGSSALNSGVISLQAGGVTKTVTIEAVTGFISVSN